MPKPGDTSEGEGKDCCCKSVLDIVESMTGSCKSIGEAGIDGACCRIGMLGPGVKGDLNCFATAFDRCGK